MPDFLPRRDADLRLWTGRLGVSLAPQASRLGVTPEALARFTTAQTAFETAMNVLDAPETRTSPAVGRKETCRAELVAATRAVVRMVRACASAEATDLLDLGLTPRRKGRAAAVAPPVEAPRVVATATPDGVSLKLFRRGDRGKARPAGTIGAGVFYHAGPDAPSRLEDWRLVGVATRAAFTFALPVAPPPGTPVWTTAAWMSARGKLGPPAAPRLVHTTYLLSHGVGATTAA